MQQNINQIILQYLKQNNTSVRTLAKSLHISSSGLWKALQSPGISVARVRDISQALNHNFFHDYYPVTLHPGNNPPPQIAENNQLKARIHQLESELAAYRNLSAIVATQVPQNNNT